jgi:hypothetical protein
MDIYQLLGWLNVVLLAVMTAPYWIRFVNSHTLHLKGGAYAKTIKVLRTIHKPLGGLILLIALVHGYLAWGTLRLHTGTFLWLSVLITASLGLLFFLTKKKALFIWHKRMVLLILAMLLIHLLFPSAVYTLFH